MDIQLIKYNAKHLWSNHKKFVLSVGLLLLVAIIL